MRNGTYRCYEADKRWNPRDITVSVKSTEKSVIMTLIEDRTRYPEALMEMLFRKSKRVVIPKTPTKPGGHPISADYDTWFIIYPFQAGNPFLFELQEEPTHN